MSNQFYKLKVKQITKETPDAVTIYFELPAGKAVNYKPGQFLTLIIPLQGEKLRRAYSLCTSPFIDKDMGVTVKSVPGGKVSNYLNQAVKAGDVLEVMEPIGNFTTEYESGRQRHVVLFGGGSGITPLMSLAKTILLLESNSTVSLIYANRDINSIIFKDDLNKLKEKYPDHFNLIHVLDVPPAGWSGYSGFLSTPLIKDIFATLPSISKTEYFICGPEPLMDIVVNSLLALNIPKDLIHKESFESHSVLEASNKSEEELQEEGIITREVKVVYDGEEYKFIVPANKSILESALDLDIDLPYSCQSGLCTACRGKCVSGKVKMDEEEGLSDRERKEGYVLTCVGHPLTANVVIEIG